LVHTSNIFSKSKLLLFEYQIYQNRSRSFYTEAIPKSSPTATLHCSFPVLSVNLFFRFLYVVTFFFFSSVFGFLSSYIIGFHILRKRVHHELNLCL
jgi:hypothetical protein